MHNTASVFGDFHAWQLITVRIAAQPEVIAGLYPKFDCTHRPLNLCRGCEKSGELGVNVWGSTLSQQSLSARMVTYHYAQSFPLLRRLIATATLTRAALSAQGRRLRSILNEWNFNDFP